MSETETEIPADDDVATDEKEQIADEKMSDALGEIFPNLPADRPEDVFQTEAPAADYADTPPAMSVPLAYPFTLDGQMVRIVDLWPPSFSDVLAVTKGLKPEIDMIAAMASLPVGAMQAMRWPDIEKVTIAARHLAPEFEGR